MLLLNTHCEKDVVLESGPTLGSYEQNPPTASFQATYPAFYEEWWIR